MRKNEYKKAVVSIAVLFILLITSVQATNISIVDNNEKTNETMSWYWKPPYPNYSPQGLPDFDQKQDRWKKISAGPNGIIDSVLEGDDILNTDENCIAPGPDCYLNSTAIDDDIEEWAFCGPVAVANCFWWFDSKYADPAGSPGDGKDQFALVQDYGSGDDHAITNPPLLIEKLAREMNTTEKGTTYIDDMQNAINNWLISTNLTNKFTIQTYNQPTFSFIENEIKRSQNVILLLGSYDFIVGPLVIDQSQNNGPLPELCKTTSWTDHQEFIPSANRLDAIQILLQSVGSPCDVQIDVFDAPPPASPIGTVVMNPGALATPTWVEFTFSPGIELTPGTMYYFDVFQSLTGYHYEWFYDSGDPYPPGQGWMRGFPYDPYGLPFDWAFKTEYFDPPPHSEKREGHYVTCAGVNSEEFMIAFSDPTMDVANPSGEDHNDAAYVSHDIYNVTIGAPKPDINCQWWLTDYKIGYDYTVVEKAVVICPVPDTTPPTVVITRPKNSLYFINIEIFPLAINTPIIIGKIDINVTATDDDSGIDRVEFYINSLLKETDDTEPYGWTWKEPAFLSRTIEVIVYDKAGNGASTVKNVLKFF